MKIPPSPYPKIDLVVRPSGIWDTRSPLFQFVQYHRKENQTYWSLILSLSFATKTLKLLPEEDDLRSIFDKKSRVDVEALKAFQSSLPGENKEVPKVRHLTTATNDYVTVLTEYAIVSYYDTFESFLQCWCLNYLLAKLEKSIDLTREERDLISAFSPVKTSKGRPIPGISRILAALPEVVESLKLCPHIFKNKSTNTNVDTPVTSNLNAYNTINFWREARNLLVHKDALISKRFYKNYESFWADLTEGYTYAPNFIANRRLVLNHHVFRPMTTTHYRAAKWLRDMLVKLSGARRGHVLAPGPEADNGKPEKSQVPEFLPKMLMNGDHGNSYRFIIDEEFRKQLMPIT